jgi:hypothetical protein
MCHCWGRKGTRGRDRVPRPVGKPGVQDQGGGVGLRLSRNGRASHTFTVWSPLPVSTRDPSGLHDTVRTRSVWPLMMSSSAPVFVSHTLADLSLLPVTTRDPSGLHDAATTGLVWPLRVSRSAPHHRAVSLDEGSKGHFVVAFDEAAEQFAVAKPRTVARQHRPAKVFDHAVHRAGRHVPPSASVPARPLLLICRTVVI